MPVELKLPDVGDNIEKGTIVTVLIKPGDSVTEGQPIVELETDKAVVEVPASAAGTVESVSAKVGDTVKIGATLATLSGEGAAAPAAAPASPANGGGDNAANVENAPAAAGQAAAQQQAQKEQAASQQPGANVQQASSQPAASTGGSQTVTLPDVGDNIAQGTVVSVLVNEGDTISEGQPIVEIETDKAVVEVPSSAAGTVQGVAVKVGDTVKIGGTLLTLSGGASAPAPAAAPAPTQAASTPAAPAPTPAAAPALTQAPGTQNPQTAAAAPVKGPDGKVLVHAAPSVRRMAREMGVDLGNLQGSGIAGRISADDLKAALSGSQNAPAAAQAPAPLAPTFAPLPNFEKWGNITREDMSGIRKATVRSMSASTAIPMVTHFDKADITNMEEARKKFGARVEKAGGKLTMTHIIMKVVANALRKFPKFGASLDLENQQVIYKDFVNLGVAVDTPQGLLVPVLKNADRLSITDMVLELNDLAAKARDRKLKPDEMQGATFTISNLGGIGGHAFTPIVNAPEVAILGVSRGGMEPIWDKEKGEFVPRNMLPLSLSYDHRLIDGADAARFVRFICESLEDPFLISL